MIISPADIRYSQDSIAHYFTGAHRGLNIGESLDLILLGKCKPEDFPKISVTHRNGEWFTGDNRRLWVFKKALELGKLSEIDVDIGYVNPRKFTTRNLGMSILVRGNPGGNIWRRYEKEKSSVVNRNADMNYLERKIGGLQLHSAPTSTIKSDQVFKERSNLDLSSTKLLRMPVSDNVEKRDNLTSNNLAGTSARFYKGDSFVPSFTRMSDRTHERKDTTTQMTSKKSTPATHQTVFLPSEIRYSKRKVDRLLNGIPLLDHVDNIAKGCKIDFIKVFINGKETIAYENEKLWILQMAEELKLSLDVPVPIKQIEVPDSFSLSFKRGILECLGYPKSFKLDTLRHLKLRETLYSVSVPPSQVHYAMNRIKAIVKGYKNIGEFLDELITDKLEGGKCSKHALDSFISSPIKVIRVENLFIALENGKLWLLHVLEKLGLCDLITLEVNISYDERFLIYPNPYQTEDKLQVILNPGGKLCKRLLMAQKDRRNAKLS